MTTCTVCGSENLDGSVYCEDCGARLPAATAEIPAVPETAPPPAPPPLPPPLPAAPEPVPVTQAAAPEPPAPAPSGDLACPACGASNPSGSVFCDACGASLGEAPAAPTPGPSETAPPPTPVAAPGRARLLMADGTVEFPCEKDEIAVGRRSPVDGIFPEVDLTDVDPDSYISRRHGRLFRQDSTFLYEDLGSSNGSFLNDTRLQKGVQTELKEGDRLRLGKTEMVFHSR